MAPEQDCIHHSVSKPSAPERHRGHRAAQGGMHPIKPRLTYRVGIVGHRPNRLPEDIGALENTILRLLGVVRSEVLAVGREHAGIFATEEPALRAVSPLAEGADRIFTKCALDLSFELCAPLPFPIEEYEQDFSVSVDSIGPLPGHQGEPDSSCDTFRALLDRARRETELAVFELDGSRDNVVAAYAACTDIVINQSDLLFVVWDGWYQGKVGGTESAFIEAWRRGVPMIWIDAIAPSRWQLAAGDAVPDPGSDVRHSPQGEGNIEDLRETVRRCIDAPRSASRQRSRLTDPILSLNAFYQERWRVRSWGSIWQVFTALLGGSAWPVSQKRTQRGPEVPDPSGHKFDAWRIAQVFDHCHIWADRLATSYANAYRSSFILVYVLSAAAVGMALLPSVLGHSVGTHRGETVIVLVELVMIVLIMVLVLLVRKRRWHERWIDYRLLTELLRSTRFVTMLGGVQPLPKSPAFRSTDDKPESSWVVWYMRAIERDVGLAHARLDSPFLLHYLHEIHTLYQDQILFHERNSERSERIEHRLHCAMIVLLAVTILACVMHLVTPFVPVSSYVLTALCAFLPALGGAIAGIENQGEFLRISRRSEAMAESMRELLDSVPTLESLTRDGASIASSVIVAHASRLSRLMLDELLEWRVLFLTKPLKTHV